MQATYKILEYDRIDISEGIDVNKTSASKECDICHYWYFKDIGFKYEPYLCNGCHDLIQKLWALMVLLLSMLKEVLTNSFLAYEQRWWISIMNNSNLIDKKALYSFFYCI